MVILNKFYLASPIPKSNGFRNIDIWKMTFLEIWRTVTPSYIYQALFKNANFLFNRKQKSCTSNLTGSNQAVNIFEQDMKN